VFKFLDHCCFLTYKILDFTRQIQNWYNLNKRDLPWRNTSDPYKIWLSEVILQQTRVDQGIPYYYKFIARFPNADSLAAANEDDVLKLWQGLGYYSRARNLHAAAKQVVGEFNGRFPNNYHHLRKLKGVGDYTAAAIASIAFNEKVPVVDGNVLRVISRFYDSDLPVDKDQGRNFVHAAMLTLIDPRHSGEFNQAVMELGALICKPRNPSCDLCPVSQICLASINGTQTDRPVKIGKKKATERRIHYLVPIIAGAKTMLVKRTGQDIWKGLYEFPLVSDELEGVLSMDRDLKELIGQGEVIAERKYRHQLTHRKIIATFTVVKFNIDLSISSSTPTTLVGVQDFPVSRLTEQFFSEWFSEFIDMK
jgi:A/G-specific adenine glycosylase